MSWKITTFFGTPPLEGLRMLSKVHIVPVKKLSPREGQRSLWSMLLFDLSKVITDTRCFYIKWSSNFQYRKGGNQRYWIMKLLISESFCQSFFLFGAENKSVLSKLMAQGKTVFWHQVRILQIRVPAWLGKSKWVLEAGIYIYIYIYIYCKSGHQMPTQVAASATTSELAISLNID